MTIDEFFQAVKEAQPDSRQDVANKLLKQLDEDERVLAESVVGDFISVSDDIYKIND